MEHTDGVADFESGQVRSDQVRAVCKFEHRGQLNDDGQCFQQIQQHNDPHLGGVQTNGRIAQGQTYLPVQRNGHG